MDIWRSNQLHYLMLSTSIASFNFPNQTRAVNLGTSEERRRELYNSSNQWSISKLATRFRRASFVVKSLFLILPT